MSVKAQHVHRGCLTFVQVTDISDNRLYSNVIWSVVPKANMDRMQRLQNRAGLRCHRRTQVGDIHLALNWKACEAGCDLHKCLLVGKRFSAKRPSIYQEL